MLWLPLLERKLNKDELWKAPAVIQKSQPISTVQWMWPWFASRFPLFQRAVTVYAKLYMHSEQKWTNYLSFALSHTVHILAAKGTIIFFAEHSQNSMTGGVAIRNALLKELVSILFFTRAGTRPRLEPAKATQKELLSHLEFDGVFRFVSFNRKIFLAKFTKVCRFNSRVSDLHMRIRRQNRIIEIVNLLWSVVLSIVFRFHFKLLCGDFQKIFSAWFSGFSIYDARLNARLNANWPQRK